MAATNTGLCYDSPVPHNTWAIGRHDGEVFAIPLEKYFNALDEAATQKLCSPIVQVQL
jgi:hypothetical protein